MRRRRRFQQNEIGGANDVQLFLSYIGQSSSEFESTFDEIGLLQRSLICAMWLNMAAILSDELGMEEP